MKAPIAAETPNESRSNVIPMTSGITTAIANLIGTMSLKFPRSTRNATAIEAASLSITRRSIARWCRWSH